MILNDYSVINRKCSKCFQGPFTTHEGLLFHIGINHGDLIDNLLKKFNLTQTLQPIRKPTNKSTLNRNHNSQNAIQEMIPQTNSKTGSSNYKV